MAGGVLASAAQQSKQRTALPMDCFVASLLEMTTREMVRLNKSGDAQRARLKR